MAIPNPWGTPAVRKFFARAGILSAAALAACLLFSGCNSVHKTDTQPLDQAGMWADSITELRMLNVSEAEVTELATARAAGLSDASCILLIKLARSRQKPFADGQAVADLMSAGTSEQTILELGRLGQLGLWAGQAEALRLVGFSDEVILAVAQRRAQNLPVLSGERLGELKNAGASDAAILQMIQQGITDQEAAYYIAEKERSAGGHNFVYQRRRKNS